jgi:ribosomal protein S17E
MADTFEIDLKRAISSNKEYQAEVKTIVKEQFEEMKAQLIENFDNHPVTEEISNPNSSNISNTLGGYGNLYGFLGFEDDNPALPVKEVLSKKTKVNAVSFRNEEVSLKFTVPDLEDFDSAASLEWDTKNWVKGIEKGISGFQSFMAKQAGRSGKGIQIKGKVKPFTGGANRFQNTKYMTDLINKFKSSLNNI